MASRITPRMLSNQVRGGLKKLATCSNKELRILAKFYGIPVMFNGSYKSKQELISSINAVIKVFKDEV